jgi:predicted transcriptional regulator
MEPIEFVVARKGSCCFLLPQQPRILSFLIILEIENNLTILEISETNTKEDTKRRIIIDYITRNPGIRYRELLRLTGFSNGGLAHHLSVLEETKAIQVCRQKKYKITRYYSLSISFKELQIIGCIKQQTAQNIIAFILKKNLCTFTEILHCIGKARSTLSWHIKRLVGAGIIELIPRGKNDSYRLINVDIVSTIINNMNDV